MESNPRDYGEQCRFDAFCKKVLRNEARACLRNMKRQREREALFSDLSQAELDKLNAKLQNPGFLAKAPENVVKAEQERAEKLAALIAQLQEQAASL